jgi:hypothetical protein
VVIASTRHARGEDARIVLQTGPAGLPLNYYPVQTVSGPHNHTATLIHNYAVSALLWAERDLREAGRLSAGAAALLGIFNVSRIVSDDGRSMGLPAIGGRGHRRRTAARSDAARGASDAGPVCA